MSDNKPLGLVEIIEEKKELEIRINFMLQQFIQLTGIYPRVTVTETEYNHRCGIAKNIDIKIIVEL